MAILFVSEPPLALLLALEHVGGAFARYIGASLGVISSLISLALRRACLHQ
jgi:hypothetical protein